MKETNLNHNKLIEQNLTQILIYVSVFLIYFILFGKRGGLSLTYSVFLY